MRMIIANENDILVRPEKEENFTDEIQYYIKEINGKEYGVWRVDYYNPQSGWENFLYFQLIESSILKYLRALPDGTMEMSINIELAKMVFHRGIMDKVVCKIKNISGLDAKEFLEAEKELKVIWE